MQTADGVTAFVKVDADTGDALESVAYVVDEAGNTTATIPLSADDKEAISKVDGVGEHASRTPAKVTVKAEDHASDVIDHIARDRESTVRVRVISQEALDYGMQDAQRWLNANGNIFEAYAEGGIRSQHTAQIAAPGAMRVWAEPETEGEAYIPFARSKRTRSVAILDQVAKRFGYSLTNATNVARFADGGQYMAQMMSRQRYSAASVRGSDQGAKVQVGPVTFANSSQKDQFREFTRTLNRVARGL